MKASILLILAVFTVLLLPVSGQCPIVCSACSSGTTCTGCDTTNIYNLTGTASATNCQPNTTAYMDPLSTVDGTLTAPSTATCGSMFNTSIPGNFTAQQSVNMFLSTTLNPHFKIRVMSSILMVGKWSTADTITMFINNVNITSKNYLSTGNFGANLSFNSTCGNAQTPTSRSYYAKLDTGDMTHTSATLNVTFISSKCNGCSSSCQCGWFLPVVMVLIEYCDQACLVCNGLTNSTCSSCAANYYKSGTVCDTGCLSNYYPDPVITFNCLPCPTGCLTCTSATVCNTCNTPSYIYHPTNYSCLNSCPGGFYNSSDSGQCEQCLNNCSKCTDYPTPCQACNTGWYYYSSDCLSSCPDGLFASITTNTCEDCTTYCIGLNISIYSTPGQSGLSPLYIDLNFTYDLDFTTFPMKTFQTVTF